MPVLNGGTSDCVLPSHLQKARELLGHDCCKFITRGSIKVPR
jgi:hypothetical protein